MKNHKYLLLVGILGCSLLFISSCKDDEQDKELTPAVETCKVVNISDVSDETIENNKFEYNDAGQLTRFQDPDEDVTFLYASGKLSSISFGGVTADFAYGSNGKPNRLSVGPEEYNLFTFDGDNLTQIEFHFADNDSIVFTTDILYDGNNVSMVTDKRYNTKTLETTLDTSTYRITTDDNKSPYSKDFATMFWVYLSQGDLNALCYNNITAYTYPSSFSDDLDISISYEYDDKDFPTKSTERGWSDDRVLLYSYKCD